MEEAGIERKIDRRRVTLKAAAAIARLASLVDFGTWSNALSSAAA